MRSIDDTKILQYFDFLTEKGFTLSRDYCKASDKTCAQIYRFARDKFNYVEYRVVTEKECTLCVCVNGQKRFPSPRKKYSGFVFKRKLARLFNASLRDEWLLDADLLKEELSATGSIYGLTI